MFVVDTNVLVYAADTHSPGSDRCLALLEEWSRGSTPWHVTWGICYEFLRTVTHRRVLRSPWSTGEACGFLEEMFASPSFSVLAQTENHFVTLAQTMHERPEIVGNRIHDLHTAVLMREHGICRIYTRDSDFHLFSFLEPIDPLKP